MAAGERINDNDAGKPLNPTSAHTALAPPSAWLIQLGMWCAALSLLSAPFRSSATLRAALFLVAALLLVLASLRERRFLIHVPEGRLLRMSASIWILFVLIHSIVWSPELRSSIASWRGDVLTPTLAALVTYSLVREGGKITPVLAALAVSIVVLAIMSVLDPARPGIGGHEPAYVNVGWLSTWAVSVSALLALVWLRRFDAPRVRAIAKWVAALSALAILVAVWQSGNRVSWLCLGGMISIAAFMLLKQQPQSPRRVIMLMAFALIASALAFLAASEMRARQFPAAQVDGVSILQQDDRKEIWRAALQAVGQQPLTGYGFRTTNATEALVRQYQDPGFVSVFRHAHNVVLNYAIQLGVPGALALMFVFFSLAYAFWIRRLGSDDARLAAACGLMLVFGVFLRNMTDDFFGRHAILLFGALVGLLLALADAAQRSNESRR